MAKNSLFAEPHFQNDEAARAMLESIRNDVVDLD